jgi:hypothetical protein
MILAITLVLLSLIALLTMQLVRGRAAAYSEVDELLGQTRQVDIEAFRNLTDPAEEEFLRANLSPGEFRSIQRERLRVAVEYINSAAHNAAILLRVGELARQSSDPEIVHAGQQLLDSALRLRLYALLTTTRLYVGIALPGTRLADNTLLDGYQRLRALASRVLVMQHAPSHHLPVSL